MCGHEFMFYGRDHLQRHRPRWQCGTCGRVSSMPLDCCTRPDFARQHPAELPHLLSTWLRACGRWTLASVRLLWAWQRRRAISIGTTHTTASPHNVITKGMSIPPADYDESSEEEVVVAGERQ